MPKRSSGKTQEYPWEKDYEAAVLETDNGRLGERAIVAEGALMARLLELTSRRDHALEIRAVEDALKGLRMLKHERLGQ